MVRPINLKIHIATGEIMKRFPGKRIFITGAASGFGRQLAVEFAKMGWKIGAADINMQGVEETIDLVNQSGGSAIPVQCDVTRPEDFETALEILGKEWRGVDIVVNNAGVAAAGFMEKIPLETWE